MDIGVCRFGRY